MSEVTNKAAACLVKAQAEVRKVAKGGTNNYDRYNYATFENFVAACESALEKAGLAVVYSVTDYRHLEPRETSKGKTEHAVELLLEARAIADDGSCVMARAVGEGQDRGDKAYYKAQTGAKKYAIAGLLNLVTTDDPEADESTARDDPKPQRSAPTQSSSGDIKELLKKWTGFRDDADLRSAWRDAGKAACGDGFDGRKSDHQTQLLEYVKKNIESGTDFAAAIGGK